MSTGGLAFKFCAFGVVTAPALARRWVLRGGSLVNYIEYFSKSTSPNCYFKAFTSDFPGTCALPSALPYVPTKSSKDNL